jgi:hypothetical protein
MNKPPGLMKSVTLSAGPIRNRRRSRIESAKDSGHQPCQSSNFLSHETEIEQVRDRTGEQASPQNGRHHELATRRDRNSYQRRLPDGRCANLPGEDQKARIGCAQMSCGREKGPGPSSEANAGKREDRKGKPEKLEPLNRNDLAQHGVASLKDAEHPEIDEPEKFRARVIRQGPGSQFGAKAGGEQRQWSQELELKQTVHATSHT